jgi:hypothetical protein
LIARDAVFNTNESLFPSCYEGPKMNDAGRQVKKGLDFTKLEETLAKAAADLSYTQSIVDTVREPLLRRFGGRNTRTSQ